MKIINTKNIHRRFVAVLCCLLGIAGFRIWEGETQAPPTRFLIRPTPEPDTPAQARDLSEYEFWAQDAYCRFLNDDLPLVELRMKKRNCISLRKKAREFVLTNWREKRKAYLVVRFDCGHCPADEHLFVEPDQYDRWHIVLRKHQGFYPGFDPSMYNQSIDQVKWRQATGDDFDFDLGESILSFINKDGVEVATL